MGAVENPFLGFSNDLVGHARLGVFHRSGSVHRLAAATMIRERDRVAASCRSIRAASVKGSSGRVEACQLARPSPDRPRGMRWTRSKGVCGRPYCRRTRLPTRVFFTSFTDGNHRFCQQAQIRIERVQRRRAPPRSRSARSRRACGHASSSSVRCARCRLSCTGRPRVNWMSRARQYRYRWSLMNSDPLSESIPRNAKGKAPAIASSACRTRSWPFPITACVSTHVV